MPKLSDSMADAVIVRWLKSPGDAFERGEGLIEVETDKATVVYEAESEGTLDLDPCSGGSDGRDRGADRDPGERRRRSGGEDVHAPAARRGERKTRNRRSEPQPAPPRRASVDGSPLRVRTRRRWRGEQRSSSASRSTASPARGPAVG